MTFGEKVKNLRKNKGLNQTQLADAVGVSFGLFGDGKLKAVIQRNMTFTRNLQTF